MDDLLVAVLSRHAISGAAEFEFDVRDTGARWVPVAIFDAKLWAVFSVVSVAPKKYQGPEAARRDYYRIMALVRVQLLTAQVEDTEAAAVVGQAADLVSELLRGRVANI